MAIDNKPGNLNNCVMCKEVFNSKPNLDFHIKTKHLRMFVCTRCPDFSTLIRARLNRHLSKTHNVTKADDVAAMKEPNVPVPAAPKPEQGVKPKTPQVETRVSQEPPAKVPTLEPKGSNTISLDEDDDDDFRLSCDQCWFAADTPAQLSDHVKTKHPEPEPEPEDNADQDSSMPVDPSTLSELGTVDAPMTLDATETAVASNKVEQVLEEQAVAGSGTESGQADAVASVSEPKLQPMEESSPAAVEPVSTKDCETQPPSCPGDQVGQPEPMSPKETVDVPPMKQEATQGAVDVQVLSESHSDVAMMEVQPREADQTAVTVNQTPEEHSGEAEPVPKDSIGQTSSPMEQENSPMEQTSVEMRNPLSIERINPSSVEMIDPSSVEMIDSSSVETTDPSSVETTDPASVGSANPSTVDLSKPSSIELINPSSVETTDPVSVELINPSSVELINPSSVELINPSSVETGNPSSQVQTEAETLNKITTEFTEEEIPKPGSEEQALELLTFRPEIPAEASGETLGSSSDEASAEGIRQQPEVTETTGCEPMESEPSEDPLTIDLGSIFKTELEADDEVLMLARHAGLIASSDPEIGIKADEFFQPDLGTSNPITGDSSNSSANTNKFKIQCNLCDFSTSDSGLMDNHLGWDGHFRLGQENICQHCTFAASTKEEYLEHGQLHSDTFSLADWHCLACSFKTGQAETIETHLKESH